MSGPSHEKAKGREGQETRPTPSLTRPVDARRSMSGDKPWRVWSVTGTQMTRRQDVATSAPPQVAASPPLPFVGAAGTPSESDAERRCDWLADADREEQER